MIPHPGHDHRVVYDFEGFLRRPRAPDHLGGDHDHVQQEDQRQSHGPEEGQDRGVLQQPLGPEED